MRLRSVYTLVGGDTRQAHVAQMLAAAGFMVHTAGVPGLCGTDACLHDAVRAADTVVLPMPAFAGGAHIRAQETIPLDAVLGSMRPGAKLLGGKLEPARPALDASGVRWLDYAEDEALQIENAALTAEAAAQLAMQHLPGAVLGCRALVIGYGRIGRRLCRILAALGADVTAAARKPADFADIRASRLHAELTGAYRSGLGGYDLIANTVPAPVLTGAQLAACRPGCVYLELASMPGGLASPAPEQLRVIDGRGLPGRYAPEAAARIIYQTLLRLDGKGET